MIFSQNIPRLSVLKGFMALINVTGKVVFCPSESGALHRNGIKV
jgi:hypothetical protein